jgi:hypothetical protein
MGDLEDFEAATERLNAGAQIVEVQPILIKRMWEALGRVRRNEEQHPAGVFVGARLDPELAPRNPEQKFAMIMRYVLLNALVESGVLDEYMKDDVLRKKVFMAAALLPCSGSDLQEAVAARVLRQSPDVSPEKKKGLTEAGFDPDHLRVADRFIEWLRDNS